MKRIFHDPIHKEIIFNSDKPEEFMIMQLIDTLAFQRLEGLSSWVQPHCTVQSQSIYSLYRSFYIARKVINDWQLPQLKR